MPTSLLKTSKCDSVLLLDVAAGDVFTDFSQERQDLDDNSPTYLSEWPSARAALTEPREISLVVDLRNTSSGILINHGSGGSVGYRISISGAVVSCSDSGGPILTVTVPDLIGGADRRVLISWCCRPEDQVTTPCVHELSVYNFTTSAWAFARIASTAQITDASWNLTINGNDSGTGGLAGGMDLYRNVRIGRRFHSTSEQALDWVSEPTPPDQDARVRPPLLTMTGLPIMGEGEFAGPSYLWAGGNSQSVELRTSSPMVNMYPLSPAEEDSTYSPTRYFRKAPAPDANFRWSTRYLRRLLIGPKHNAARVRVFLQSYNKDEDGPTRIFLRCYSATGLPLMGQPPTKLKFSRTATTTVEVDHGLTGLGEWFDLGKLTLIRELEAADRPWWRTYCMLGSYIDPDDDLAEADTYFKIKAWTVEPFRDDSDGGGFDQQDEKKKG